MTTPVFQPPPTHAEVVIKEPKTGRWMFNPVWIKWLMDLVKLLTNSGGGGGTFIHNLLFGLQGGTSGEYYHFTAAEHTSLQTIAVGGALNSDVLAVSTALTIPSGKQLFLVNDYTINGDLTVNGRLGVY